MIIYTTIVSYNINIQNIYYFRDKDKLKRGVESTKMLSEIADSRYRKGDSVSAIAKKQWESTKVKMNFYIRVSSLVWSSFKNFIGFLKFIIPYFIGSCKQVELIKCLNKI